MSASPSLNPQVLGRAENAHRALLTRILAGTDGGTGTTYEQWVALTLASVGGGAVDRDQIVARLAGALKSDDAGARDVIEQLIAADRVRPVPGDESRIEPTAAGGELFRGVRAEVDATIERVYGDVAAEDLASAGRVLAAITARIDDELADRGKSA
jgi:hypothetical protein